jgi:glucose-6-phosphate 1-dehydrogenase
MVPSVETTVAGDEQQGADSDVLVIFGITGDLAKKMTFRALYRLGDR